MLDYHETDQTRPEDATSAPIDWTHPRIYTPPVFTEFAEESNIRISCVSYGENEVLWR